MTAHLPAWLRGLLPDMGFLEPLPRPGPLATTWAITSLLVMMIAAVAVVRGGRWPWRVLLVLGALSWPLPDHPAQGPVLLDVGYHHGVHLADLLSVVAAIVAVLPWRRTRRPGQARNRPVPGDRRSHSE